jgi:hypothetical protein
VTEGVSSVPRVSKQKQLISHNVFILPFRFAWNFATNQIGWGVADFSTSFSNIEINDEAPRLTLCDAHNVGIQDVYMIDKDSSLKPAHSTATGVSVLVSDHPNMRHFIPDSENKCVSDARGCFRYCPQSCLRSVSYSIDPADPKEYHLRVCERGNLNNCILYEGHSREELDTSDRFVRHAKTYYVALPSGRYDAAFIDSTFTVSWPAFAEEVYHPALCSGAVADGAIWLQKPRNTTVLEKQCLGLIRNGGADWSNVTHSYWLAGPDGIQLAVKKGITTAGSGNLPSNALCQYPSASQRDQSYSMGQYIDTRCLILNRRYSVKAWVRRSTANNWQDEDPVFLDETSCSDNCVEAGFHLVRPNGSTFTIKLTTSNNIFDADTTGTRQRGLLRNLQGLDSSYNGFSLVEGELVVTTDVASAVSAFFYIHRNHKASNVTLCVDNVSMNLVI